MEQFYKHGKDLIVKCFLWLALALLVGGVCGLFGGLFAKLVEAVTDVRTENTWLLYCLPIAGVLTVVLYGALRVKKMGTEQVIAAAVSSEKVSFWLAPAVFVSAVFAHLCGGSVGKEGAALQIGGGISAGVSRLLRLPEEARRTLTLCGMAALFSAAFGTPIAAAVFVFEVARVGRKCAVAFLPTLVSAVCGYLVSLGLHVEPERFLLGDVTAFSFDAVWRVAIIAAACAVVSIVFCYALFYAKKSAFLLVGNAYLRVVIGAVVVILLTVLVGDAYYNGSGAGVIHQMFASGTVRYEAFALKMLFTVVTVAAGFKGGEIVPSLFIGASLGLALSCMLGLPPTLGAAVGMMALFCGVTNCPFATLVLSMELFGGKGIVYFLLATGISFLLSGKCSLYMTEHDK